MAAYTLEKRKIVEFIRMYKDQECLWNTSHPLYSNRLARNRALNTILEKYKEFDSSADQRAMKKRFENMRTTYKREYNKIIKSRLTGVELYEPSLWYFSEMRFLDELNENPTKTDIADTTDRGDTTNDTDYADDDDERSESPPRSKRPTQTSVYLTEGDNNEYSIETIESPPPTKKAKTSIVYLDEGINYQEESCSIKNEPSDEYLGTTSASDLYGKTISTQLTKLRPKQRFIAEKLISDVIFFGRLDKLKTGTKLDLNVDL